MIFPVIRDDFIGWPGVTASLTHLHNDGTCTLNSGSVLLKEALNPTAPLKLRLLINGQLRGVKLYNTEREQDVISKSIMVEKKEKEQQDMDGRHSQWLHLF